jgi:hypothetical protein
MAGRTFRRSPTLDPGHFALGLSDPPFLLVPRPARLCAGLSLYRNSQIKISPPPSSSPGPSSRVKPCVKCRTAFSAEVSNIAQNQSRARALMELVLGVPHDGYRQPDSREKSLIMASDLPEDGLSSDPPRIIPKQACSPTTTAMVSRKGPSGHRDFRRSPLGPI